MSWPSLCSPGPPSWPGSETRRTWAVSAHHVSTSLPSKHVDADTVHIATHRWHNTWSGEFVLVFFGMITGLRILLLLANFISKRIHVNKFHWYLFIFMVIFVTINISTIALCICVRKNHATFPFLPVFCNVYISQIANPYLLRCFHLIFQTEFWTSFSPSK